MLKVMNYAIAITCDNIKFNSEVVTCGHLVILCHWSSQDYDLHWVVLDVTKCPCTHREHAPMIRDVISQAMDHFDVGKHVCNIDTTTMKTMTKDHGYDLTHVRL